jgi:hypothetical protein
MSPARRPWDEETYNILVFFGVMGDLRYCDCPTDFLLTSSSPCIQLVFVKLAERYSIHTRVFQN